MVLTSLSCPADALVHYPSMTCDLHKVPDDFGRKCDVFLRINRLIHGDKDNVIVLEQQTLGQLSEKGNSS
jgi:hypothetical protein